MNISILLSTYKRPAVLTRTLESFCQLDSKNIKFEILVVDNAGDEESKRVVLQFMKRIPIRYYVCKVRGKNNALNYVLPYVQGDLVVFTDDDIIVDTKWLKELWEGQNRWKDRSIFGGRILPDHPENIPEAFRQLKDYKAIYAVADWPIPEGPYSPYQVYGGNYAVRREIFLRGWRFDPQIGAGTNIPVGDETDFLLRLEKGGYIPIYLPSVFVLHQIRPEQLEYSWIVMKAFLGGRSYAREDRARPLPRIAGVPRYLIRQLIEAYWSYLVSRVRKSDLSKVQQIYQLKFIEGQIYQHSVVWRNLS